MVANIKINLMKVGFEGVDWIYLCMAQYGNSARTL
jgi:hypothetical protein